MKLFKRIREKKALIKNVLDIGLNEKDDISDYSEFLDDIVKVADEIINKTKPETLILFRKKEKEQLINHLCDLRMSLMSYTINCGKTVEIVLKNENISDQSKISTLDFGKKVVLLSKDADKVLNSIIETIEKM